MCNAERIGKAVNKGKEVWEIIKEVEISNSVKKNTLSKLDLEERGVVFDGQRTGYSRGN